MIFGVFTALRRCFADTLINKKILCKAEDGNTRGTTSSYRNTVSLRAVTGVPVLPYLLTVRAAAPECTQAVGMYPHINRILSEILVVALPVSFSALNIHIIAIVAYIFVICKLFLY